MTTAPERPERPDADDLDRLCDAVEAYIDRRSEPSGTVSVDQYLEQHSGVRDLLEPMLDDRPGVDDEDGAVRRLGGYRLGRELGRGGMGVVYEAVEESLGRRVALKVLSAGLTLSPRQVERFRREAAAAARLVHPDIVRIHAIGEHEGVHFIAMELVEGQSLREVIDAVKARVRGDASRLGSRDLGVAAVVSGSTTAGGGYFDQVAEVAARIAEVLAYSHERGVVHRDVKPQNVLLGPDGKVCVVDFGLAKDLEAESLSRTGDFAGTPQYVSPEQIDAGRVPIDGRADVFSLGVVLYELLTLSPPFLGSTTRQLMNAITGHEPPAPRVRSPQVPRDLETITLKALEKDPRRRYRAAELAADLRRYLAREPIAARPTSLPLKVVRFAHRKPAAAVAAVLAFLLLVVTPAAASLYYKQARDAIALEQQRTVEQRDLAQKLLGQVRESVRQLFSRVSGLELEAIPHTEGLRMQLLRDASALCDDFLAIASDDPELRFQAARAGAALAGMQRSLSRPTEALRSIEAALPLLEAAVGSGVFPGAVEIDLAVVHQLRAHLLLDLERNDEALASLGAADALLQPLDVDELEDGRRYQARMARAGVLDGRRRHAMRSHPTAEAQEFAEQAVEILTDLVREAPADAKAARLLSEGIFHLATIQLWRGRLVAARAGFERADAMLGELLERQPDFPAHRFRLSQTLLGLSDVYRRLGIEGGGDAERRRAIELLRALVVDFGQFPVYRRELLRLSLHEALQQSAHGRTVAEAARAMPDLLADAERLAGLADATGDDRLNLATAHKILAQVELMRIDRDAQELERHFAAATGILRELVAADPDSTRYRIDLGAILSNRANWLLTFSGEPPATALPLVEEAIALQSAVVDEVPTNATARSYLGVHWSLLAVIGSKTADPALLERAAIGTVDLAPNDSRQLRRAVGFLCEACPLVGDAAERARLQALACGWLGTTLPEDAAEARRVLGQESLQPLADHPAFAQLRARVGG